MTAVVTAGKTAIVILFRKKGEMMLNTEVARKLEQALGLGEFPMVRRRLYSRVQRACQKHGDVALTVTAQALEEAKSLRDRGSGGPAAADSKGRWFSKTIVIRLGELGYWHESSPNQAAMPAEDAKRQLDQLRSKLGNGPQEGAL